MPKTIAADSPMIGHAIGTSATVTGSCPELPQP
jgi:hypothetical protein